MFLSCEQHSREEKGSGIFHKKHKHTAIAARRPGHIMPGLEHGLEQSPINIHSDGIGQDKVHHHITLYYKDEVNKVENKGTTVQLYFKEGSTIVVDDTVFNFKQCHFHTPSEHHIDGVAFPMEMHIVNMMQGIASDSIPQYLVISVLFKEGKENKFIAEFLNSIPNEANSVKEVKVGTVRLLDLFKVVPAALKGHYYQYRGSLTTPPYTETVRWYVSQFIFEASPSQIEAIRNIEGNNARRVNALYGRVVSSE